MKTTQKKVFNMQKEMRKIEKENRSNKRNRNQSIWFFSNIINIV